MGRMTEGWVRSWAPTMGAPKTSFHWCLPALGESEGSSSSPAK